MADTVESIGFKGGGPKYMPYIREHRCNRSFSFVCQHFSVVLNLLIATLQTNTMQGTRDTHKKKGRSDGCMVMTRRSSYTVHLYANPHSVGTLRPELGPLSVVHFFAYVNCYLTPSWPVARTGHVAPE